MLFPWQIWTNLFDVVLQKNEKLNLFRVVWIGNSLNNYGTNVFNDSSTRNFDHYLKFFPRSGIFCLFFVWFLFCSTLMWFYFTIHKIKFFESKHSVFRYIWWNEPTVWLCFQLNWYSLFELPDVVLDVSLIENSLWNCSQSVNSINLKT